MIDLDSLVKTESTADVILFLAGRKSGIGYPQLDRYFSNYKSSVIESGEFMQVFEGLRKNGSVAWGDKMLVTKGPNWKEPTFVTQKKYGIV
jgi:hypothetical protein